MSVQSEAEQFKLETGLELPKVLIDLYCSRGNGWLGLDHEVLGVITRNHQDSMLDVYQSLNQPDPDDPGWAWPKDLVPFIGAGCCIYICFDLSRPDSPVFHFDPNGLGHGDPMDAYFTEEADSLATWLSNHNYL